MKLTNKTFSNHNRILLSGVPEGLDALALHQLTESDHSNTILHIARDDTRLAILLDNLKIFSSKTKVFEFPGWDCLPYDRVSPNIEITGRRLNTLRKLTIFESKIEDSGPLIILTTVNAILQRVPPKTFFLNTVLTLTVGETINSERLSNFLIQNGFNLTGTVRETGEVAFRGGIVDIFPAGSEKPVRLDLFGEKIENIKHFNPADQRSTQEVHSCTIHPAREFILDSKTVSLFRSKYRQMFGDVTQDSLYEAVSEKKIYPGIEHWIPFLHNKMETLFDYLSKYIVTFDFKADEVIKSRLKTIWDLYNSRHSFLVNPETNKTKSRAPIYHPLPPEDLYLTELELTSTIRNLAKGWFTPFSSSNETQISNYDVACDLGGRRGKNFTAKSSEILSTNEKTVVSNIFDKIVKTIHAEHKTSKRVAIVAYSEGSRKRLLKLLRDHGIKFITPVCNWEEFSRLDKNTTGVFLTRLEKGFTSGDFTIITEQDIFGERITRKTHRQRPIDFILDLSEITKGDYVVHLDHGIGGFEGIETIIADNKPHDCLIVKYLGGDQLFVPVENIDLLSRYGSNTSGATLDRLGSASWQARKAKLKNRLKVMADELINVAAKRTLQPGKRLTVDEELYEKFCTRFPYQETEDQLNAIDEALNDLAIGKPMDRLVCGDVGFGKTEIALRTAFSAVFSGGQVAIVTPTTLLARQHFNTFIERFAGYPVRIEQLSRMITQKQANATKSGMQTGEIDIVIGTHALLSPSIKFKNLALLIVDEEQHFGVSHKEQLKQLRNNVHVLTLTATPIPRTLQMALSGVKEMSVIATPPVDRLSVRTFILPYDPLVIREAIAREIYRGGQIFYVCPRISDLKGVEQELKNLNPDLKISIAHGKLKSRELERVMTEFYEGKSELLLSTQIVESGLDIPSANTLFVHRSDRFGLSQLHQLRGRIGRSKQRAYCYLMLSSHSDLSSAAEKRLEVMQAFDSLGAGFTLASHDLDIRGAGNLLGGEQSGHIREVGVELYQHMLEEVVSKARGDSLNQENSDWSPEIKIAASILIPETYVRDLNARLRLYRRVSEFKSESEIEIFASELIDRFGPLPPEVENLLKIIFIKQLCKQNRVNKLDAGPKGLVMSFENNEFTKPAALIKFIQKNADVLSLRSDHRIILKSNWQNETSRLEGVKRFLIKLVNIQN